MALTKVKLISDGVITVDNLHESHGITTTHIGEGNKLFYTDARVQSYLSANDYATIDGGYFTNATLSANILTFDKSDGTTDSVDLSLYLDDTNLARLVSGTLDALTGVATFTRDDSSTFTIDFSAFLSDANDYVSSGSFNTATGVLTLTRLGGATVTVDLDGKYAESSHTHIWTDITDRPTALSSFTNDLGNYGGFLTSFTETDPIYTASSWYSTTNNSSNWNTAYGWGNHASAGYLTSFTETDPTVPSYVKSITTTNISNWDTAYGWGNHAGLYSLVNHTHNYLYSAPSQLTSTNLNDLSTSGVYFADDQYGTNTGLPIANYFTMLNIMNGGGRQAQLFFGDTPGSAYWRPKQGPSVGWHGWENLITSHNIGSQSVNYASTAGTVAWSNVSSKPSNIMYYQGFTLDANTMDTNSTGFTYAVNAPYTGPIARFSTGGGYDLWLNSPYSGNGYGLAFRTRNGDSGTFNSWQYPAVYNVNANGGGSLYSTAIYDSNDTNYYIDQNSQSRINRLNISEAQQNAVNNAGGRLRITSYTNGESEINGNTHNIMLGPASTRTGTGYYAGIAINGLMNYSGGTGYDVAPHIWFGAQYRDTPGSERSDFVIAIKSGVGVSGTGTDIPQERFRVDYNGIASASGDMRAPIFYDSNNTAYYVDPYGVSKLGFASFEGDGNAYNARTTSGVSIGRYAGSYSFIELGSDSAAGSWIDFSKADGQDYAGRIRYWNSDERFVFDTAGADRAYLHSSYFTHSSSLRAPVFYDSNDTSYWIDPSSGGFNMRGGTSNQVTYSTNNSGFKVQNAEGNGVSDVRLGAAWGVPGVYSSSYISLMSEDYIEFRIGNYQKGYMDSASNLYAHTSMRSPIFYDSNNSGYFVDPASSSNLNDLNIQSSNSIVMYRSQTVDMSGAGYSTSNYYPVIIGVPTDGALIEIQNNLNSNVPSWSTHSGGFTINLRWWVNGSGWGTTEVKRKVYQWHERFTSSRICGGITQMGSSSQEVVYLRGGGVYYFRFSKNLSATPYSSNYANPYNVEFANVTSSPINDVWNSASGTETYYAGDIYASNMQSYVYYDRDNTSYYLDASSTGDSLRVAGDVVAYYSDERLKNIECNIPDAIEKVKSLNGFYYTANETAQKLGYKEERQVGLSAQEVEAIMPEVVKEAAIGKGYKTLDYSKIVPLLVEAIKEQQKQIEELKAIVNGITK